MNEQELRRQLRAVVESAATPVSPEEAMSRATRPSTTSRKGSHTTIVIRRLSVATVAILVVVIFFCAVAACQPL